MLARRENHPGTVGLILRRTYPELYKTHLLKLFDEYPVTRGWYSQEHKVLNMPNGSKLFFGYAEHEQDMSAFYSAEFDDILVDEAQEFSQGELERLSGSNRSTVSGITAKMVMSFMPGISESGLPPKGLDYLRRVFVKGELREHERLHKWAFIQAFAWDNYYWAKDELAYEGISAEQFYSWPEEQRQEYFLTKTEYAKTLGSMSTSLRDAWLYGKWDTFQGQYFQQFSYDRHTVDPETIKLLPFYRRWLSCDWGHDHPACVHKHARLEDGRIYTYGELWGREIGETELGHEIGLLCQGDKISDFVMSWDAFGKLNKFTRKSITEMVGNALPPGIPKPTPGDASPGSRISGWRNMANLLDSGQWIISRECTKLIECLPTLVRDMERNTEDVLKVDYSENYIGDDSADCARMGLQHELAQAAMPIAMKINQRIEAANITDPTSEMIWRRKFENQERKKIQPAHLGRAWRRFRAN